MRQLYDSFGICRCAGAGGVCTENPSKSVSSGMPGQLGHFLPFRELYNRHALTFLASAVTQALEVCAEKKKRILLIQQEIKTNPVSHKRTGGGSGVMIPTVS